ncbi:GNAT family N-acetyltransferase [Rhodohalobacter sp. SW132]|uniref:GNAT family N-acetyltransferase n=1 Tax=Rhodohalobacter sp. SW132 TaxID=2293433 RepID=UPI000E233318|nr:GNAT family N-acetyltransferase [Rhodohalobacter sp. SW132]REL38818.1 GNAT family N-acetyltransferase [Rhodohalobacter sp. SW132]
MAHDTNIEISPRYFTLHNGRRLLVRGITPDDKYHFRSGIKRLSQQSTYYRFHSPLYELSEHDLGYFTEVDQENHVAIGAIDLDNNEKPGIGVARYIRLKQNPSMAEMAITVLDEYQRQGIGTILMNELHRLAYDRGIRSFKIYLHTERRKLVKWLIGLGAKVQRVSGEIVEIELPVFDVNSD